MSTLQSRRSRRLIAAHTKRPRVSRLRRWLTAPGSLSQRLKALGTPFEVRLVFQGFSQPLPGEAQNIQSKRLYAREVLLLVAGEPLVYARSVTARRYVPGPWRSVRTLGTRPLAELLFNHCWVRRSALSSMPIQPCSRWHKHIQQRCHELAPSLANTRILWARHSIFFKAGRPLQVLEAFSPSILFHDTQHYRLTQATKPELINETQIKPLQLMKCS